MLADDLERVEQRRHRHHRGPVLVVVEDGDVDLLLEPLLDLEAARRGDVLEVDAAEGRGHQPHRVDDLLRVVGVEADRERVDVGELLEEHRLALHHRHRGLGADVAEAEHRAAVGDDRDGVALDRELERLRCGRRRSPGRRARRPACRPSRGRRGSSAGTCSAARSCRRGASAGCGRRNRAPERPRVEPIARRISSQCCWLRASIVNSRTRLPSPPAPGTRSTPCSAPPASAICAVSLPSGSCRASSSTRTVTENCAETDGIAGMGGVILCRRSPRWASGAGTGACGAFSPAMAGKRPHATRDRADRGRGSTAVAAASAAAAGAGRRRLRWGAGESTDASPSFVAHVVARSGHEDRLVRAREGHAARHADGDSGRRWPSGTRRSSAPAEPPADHVRLPGARAPGKWHGTRSIPWRTPRRG